MTTTIRKVRVNAAAAIAALVLAAVLVLLAVPLAQATEQPFTPIDTKTGGERSTSTVSTVTGDTVTLVQDGRDSATAGTSAETANLGVQIEAGGYLTVDYQLEAQEQSANGAVRFFAYYSTDADTWGTAPDLVTTAPVDVMSESLVLHVPADVTIGTVGVVYDTSNPSTGTVTFTKLGYSPGDDQSVVSLSFLKSEEPVEDPSDEPTDEPSDETPAKGDDAAGGEDKKPAAVPTAVPAGVDTLPNTGVSPAVLAGVALLLVAAGGGLVLQSRRPARRAAA